MAAMVAAGGALLSACASSEREPGAPGACHGVELLVATSNYSTAGASICAIPGACRSGADLGDDPMLTTTNGRTFFLARDSDLIFEVDAACGEPTSKLSVTALAPVDPVTGVRRPANPQDVGAAPDGTLLVPLYDVGRIAIFGPGETEPTAIDLSPYDEVDENPQANAVRVVDVGGAAKAFVTLERLDDHDKLRSSRKSQMLRLDVATRSIEAVVDLEGRNPFNAMSELGASLFMAEPGNFDDDAEELAGIERFDTATSTTRLLVRERDLGGSVAEVAVTAGCGAAIVAGPEIDVNPTWLVTFDPETGRVLSDKAAPPLGPTPGYDLQGLAWRGRTLYVGDRRRGSAGYPVHVFDLQDGCVLTDAGRKLDLPARPVALRPAQQLERR